METDKQKSEFNYAVAFLNRLNILFYFMAASKSEMDINGWYNSLVNIFSELSTDIPSKEISDRYEQLKSIADDINRNTKVQNKTGNIGIPKDLYWNLLDFEIYLRRVMDDAGYQTKRSDDPGKAFR